MDLGILALICAAALLGPVLSLVSRGAVPVVVGQLLAGVVLGRTLLDVVDPAKADLALLYDVGFATLMFTVGMHVPLHDGCAPPWARVRERHSSWCRCRWLPAWSAIWPNLARPWSTRS